MPYPHMATHQSPTSACGILTQLTNDESTSVVMLAPVYSDAAGGFKKAIADGSSKATVIGIVIDQLIASTAKGDVLTTGLAVATTAQWDAVCGTSGGLAFGVLYYLSTSVAGTLTTSSTSGVPVIRGFSPTVGALAFGSGGGSLSGLTATKLPKATSSSTVGDSSITDNGTYVQFGNPVSLGGAPINQNSFTVQSTSTTQTTVGWLQSSGTNHVGNGGINEQIPLVIRDTTTFDTTTLSGYSAGIDLAVSSTRAAGANPLVNKGIAIACSGGDTNLAIDVQSGTSNFQDANFAGNTAVTGTATFATSGTTTLCDSSHDATVGRKVTVNGSGSLADAVIAKGNVRAGDSATTGLLRAQTQNGQDAVQMGYESGPKYWSFYPSTGSLKVFEYNGQTGAAGNDRFFFNTGGGCTSLSYLQVSGTSGAKWSSGAGAPGGVVTGNPGDLYCNTNGGAGTTLYVKESGVGTTAGWVAK